MHYLVTITPTIPAADPLDAAPAGPDRCSSSSPTTTSRPCSG